MGIIAIAYLLLFCFLIKSLYKDYKAGAAIPLVQEGRGWLSYLFLPAYLPFSLLSYRRILSNKGKYNKCKQSVLTNVFAHDSNKLKEFEKYMSSRCGTFDVSFYYVLDSLSNIDESKLTRSRLYDMVSKLILENNIKIEKDKISQVAFDLLSCYYQNKYNETETQRIIRLIKAGFDVRSTELGRDEEKHPFKCEYEGHERDCPKDCDSCVVSLKTDADVCLLQNNYEEAIEKYKLVVQKEHKFAEAWNNLASAYGFLGNHSYALDAYLKAIDLDPMYGKALWGAFMALTNLGREAEAMTILDNLLKYYDFKDANKIIADFKDKGISPISVCRNQESQCLMQITLIAKYYGLECSTIPVISMKEINMFEEIFSPFFDYLVSYYEEVNIIKLSKVVSKFMLLAGMAAAKYFFYEKSKVITEGIVKLLSSPRGFYAMDEYCCDYLGIQYEPDKGNALSPCIAQMTQEANRIYTDRINQIKKIEQIKVLVHDIASSFFVFGYNYVESKLKDSLPIILQPKDLSKRDLLALRLKMMANDPTIMTVEHSNSAMCYSIAEPEEEACKCAQCGCVFYDIPEDGVVRYYEEIRKMGYDCKLERWCRDCCIKQGLEVSNYSKSRFVFYLRLNSVEQYNYSSVYTSDLRILYHLFKNENMYTGGFKLTKYDGDEVVKKLLGVKKE